VSEDVYSKILNFPPGHEREAESGGAECGHCGTVHALLPRNRVEVLNTLGCHRCGKSSFLRPDEQLAYYRARGMEPQERPPTPDLVWNGTAYVASGLPAPVAPASTAPAAGA